VRNLVIAVQVIWRFRPRLIVTTGAGIAVPFAWLGRIAGAKIVYVESLTRITTPSLTCRLVAPVAARVYVQWPELAESIPHSRYVGTVLSEQ
jgi:UDP-N-acetylglucosamine:LPS N-acetylglucosamine transferase